MFLETSFLILISDCKSSSKSCWLLIMLYLKDSLEELNLLAILCFQPHAGPDDDFPFVYYVAERVYDYFTVDL